MMDKRLLLAAALSMVVILVYPFLVARITPGPQDIPAKEPIISKEETVELYAQKDKLESREESLPVAPISASIVTDRYDMGLSQEGGAIQKIQIKDGKRKTMVLVEGAISRAGILSMEGKGPLEGLYLQPFEIRGDTNSFYAETNAIKVEKELRFFKDTYGMKAYVRITNKSNSPQELSYEITIGSNISQEELGEARYISAEVLYKDGRLKKIASANAKRPNVLYNNQIEWLALKNKYYSIIAKPDFSPSGIFAKSAKGSLATGFIIEEEEILPGETKAYGFLFYMGPTEIGELEKVEQSFSKAVNFGVLTNISLVLLTVLRFFYRLFHNYGVSILLLTFCVSLLLYPLSFKSLKSMRRLQELHPHIEKVREQHKDNPHKLNKEIMEVYRRYNVNPMSGCLPILLQMPVFIALYQTLMRSVELKGASFLWIKDLSMPDAAFTIPRHLPLLGNAINILPILMIGAMILQQKISQGKTTSGAQLEQQKIMGMLMPIVFGFVFYALPSGLVLYWLTNTILTTSLQFIFLKKA